MAKRAKFTYCENPIKMAHGGDRHTEFRKCQYIRLEWKYVYQMWWTDASRPYGDDRRYSENIRIININNRDVKRGQMLEAEVEAKARTSRPSSRPRPNTWGRGRGRGHNLEAEVEAEAKFNRPSPGPKLKSHNENICHKTLCDH